MVRLPATALMPVNRGVHVAVLGGGNKMALKSIELGRDFGDSVEVTAGLAPQDRVIDSPPETLLSGEAVQLATATASSTSTQAGAQTAPYTLRFDDWPCSSQSTRTKWKLAERLGPSPQRRPAYSGNQPSRQSSRPRNNGLASREEG
jgi:hypothetical protein